MKICKSINYILKLVEQDGNSVLSISKSELMDKVIWMKDPLTNVLRNKINLTMNNLKYRKTQSMPHNPATECYICEECKNVIVFPE